MKKLKYSLYLKLEDQKEVKKCQQVGAQPCSEELNYLVFAYYK